MKGSNWLYFLVFLLFPVIAITYWIYVRGNKEKYQFQVNQVYHENTNKAHNINSNQEYHAGTNVDQETYNRAYERACEALKQKHKNGGAWRYNKGLFFHGGVAN